MALLAWRAGVLMGALAALALVASSCAAAKPDPVWPTSCAADHYESNDSSETAHELPSLKDETSSRADILALTLHSTGDSDWFRIPIVDSGWMGNPVITVVAPSSAFKVSTWFVCDSGVSGGDERECRIGSPINETLGETDNRRWLTEGCSGADMILEGDDHYTNVVQTTTDCSGTSDDGGTLYIRVRFTRAWDIDSEDEAKKLTCDYDLAVTVE